MLQLGQSLLRPEYKNVMLRKYAFVADDSSQCISVAVACPLITWIF